MKDDSNFREKISAFINFSQNTNDNNSIKSEYLKLVKEFHPDVNKELSKETACEYMIIINYTCEQLMHNKNNFSFIKTDEYEKNKIDGKYCFINEFGVKELISDKIYYIYKLGRLEFNNAYMIMHRNPSYKGNKEKTGYEIIGHLYKAYKYYKDVIKMDKTGEWKKGALVHLRYAYKMNENITRGLSTSGEKALVEI
jgi:DnaJ-class molecular chaperone